MSAGLGLSLPGCFEKVEMDHRRELNEMTDFCNGPAASNLEFAQIAEWVCLVLFPLAANWLVQNGYVTGSFFINLAGLTFARSLQSPFSMSKLVRRGVHTFVCFEGSQFPRQTNKPSGRA